MSFVPDARSLRWRIGTATPEQEPEMPDRPTSRSRPAAWSRPSATSRPSTASTSRSARGSVYGVLGPNGAGKTTTIRMLATLLRPDAGSARVLGHDIVDEADEVRARVSLTGQLASVDEDLTGRENLILIGRLLGLVARRREGARRPSCSRRSGSPTPRAGWSRTTPAACAGGSTSPPASSSPPS